ncbi:DNA repair and recombination protein RadA [Candidatus Micrarchaeota archaeon]|nr:DNA repair and recombination protein RadA [Candidatus Micrarchaeota archaeon]
MTEEKYTLIKELEDLPGIGGVTADKLRKAGYNEIPQIAASNPHELAEAGEFGVEAAKKAISAAKDAIETGFERADQILERRKTVKRIATGSSRLDELLGGGIETQAITECFGKFSSGKSQVGFQLAVNLQNALTNEGETPPRTLFIDTESTFRPERVVQLAESNGMDPEQTLQNILVARAENSDHQIILLEKAEQIIKKENIRLIIVDSLTSQFRADYVGRGALGERQQKLNKHVHTLQKFADRYNLAIYVTNQVMDNPAILFGDPTTPIGGHVLAHAATYRVYLRKSKESKRIARLIDSPSLPEGEAVFRVTEKGIGD